MNNNINKTNYHDNLKRLMDELVHHVYNISARFPKEEQFGLTSQLRRATLSIILNYIEGFARQRKQVFKNFLEISYGSLKEVKYLLYFSYKRKYINEKEYQKAIDYTEEIGKMTWGILINLKK
jgi:four helix bundle protein